MLTLDAVAARREFPHVVGTIDKAEVFADFAVLFMGKRAYGVICRGEFVGCCPSRKLAIAAGQRRAYGG